MKKVIRLTESDLTRIVKRVIKEKNEDGKIHIPLRYGGVRMELGKNANPRKIIDLYNEIVEAGTPLVDYSEYGTEGMFYNEGNEEIPVDTVLDELNYAIVGEEGDEDYMDDSPKRKRFGDGNENEIYLTDNVRFHRTGGKLTLSYTPTKSGGGLTISDKQKKMLIDFLSK